MHTFGTTNDAAASDKEVTTIYTKHQIPRKHT